MFIIRDMALGSLRGDAFSGPQVVWHGTTDRCEMAAAHGLEYKPGSIVLQRVYEIVDLEPTGSGSVVTYGAPTWDEAGQRVTRTVTRSLPPATADMVQAECARRQALGFDYDFADARGVHRIGTTDKDMVGWREVTDIASARINTSDTTAILISTDTGAAQVTPMEWQEILKAAAAFRQPIWLASFTLQAMSPIPTDYTNDSYWTAEE